MIISEILPQYLLTTIILANSEYHYSDDGCTVMTRTEDLGKNISILNSNTTDYVLSFIPYTFSFTIEDVYYIIVDTCNNYNTSNIICKHTKVLHTSMLKKITLLDYLSMVSFTLPYRLHLLSMKNSSSVCKNI